MDFDVFWLKCYQYRRFTMPPQITCASALPGKTGNTKIAFFTQMLYQSRALQQLDCAARKMHPCAVFLKEKIVICDVFDSI